MVQVVFSDRIQVGEDTVAKAEPGGKGKRQDVDEDIFLNGKV